jgi:MFS family permease
MVIPFLAIYLTAQLGMAVQLAGLYLALYGIGGVLGALIGSRLSERFGTVRAMQITLATAAAGFLTLGVVRDPVLLALVLIMTSIAAEGFRTPSSADIGLTAGPEIRARAFALRRLAINVGMTLGPAVGGILATIHYGWLFAIDGLTCLLAAIAVGVLLRPRAAHSSRPDETLPDDTSPTRVLLRSGSFLAMLACAALMTLAFGQLMGTYPLTLKQDFGHSEAIIGALMALNTLLIVAFEMVLQYRLVAARAPRVIAAGCLTLAVGYLLVPYDPRLSFAILAMTVITIGEMLTYPVIEGFVVGLASTYTIGRAVGMLNAVFAGTFVLAPLIGTAIYDIWGYRTLWYCSAAITVLSSIGVAVLDIRRR